MRARMFRTLTITFFLIAVAMARQDKSTTLSKPADAGGELITTMKFIQNTLNGVGPVNYAVHGHDSSNGHDWTNHFSNHASAVIANPTACRINYHYKAIRDNQVLMDGNAGFLLKDVQKVDVQTRRKYLDEENLKIGHPSWTAKVDPSVFIIRVQRPANVENQFVFLDEVEANRVAKALTRAVELCTRNK
jgi:hypothetical protein